MIEEKSINIDISHPSILNTYMCLWTCGYNQTTHNQMSKSYESPPSNEKWMHLYNPFTTSSVIDTAAQRHTFLRWDEESNSTITNRKFKSIWNTVPLYTWSVYNSIENYQWEKYNLATEYKWLTYPATRYYRWSVKKRQVVSYTYQRYMNAGVGMSTDWVANGTVTYSVHQQQPTSNYNYKYTLIRTNYEWVDDGIVESTNASAYASTETMQYNSLDPVWKKSSSVENGAVTSFSRQAYVDDGYNESINKWTNYNTSYLVRNTYIARVESTNRSAYSDNGITGNYYYIYYGMYYSRGTSRDNTVKSTDINAYPSNGRSSYDGYWYVKQ